MEIFWTSVTLLSLCLFQSTLSETQSMCKGNLPTVKYIALNKNVTVPCPVLIAPDMDFTLFKGPEEVISIYVKKNNTSLSKEKKSPNIDFPAEFSVNDLDNTTSFMLVGVTKNMTDLYTCEAKINYPPPFKTVDHTPQAIVFVEDRDVKALCQHSSREDLWVVLGFLSMYGVVLTCILFMLRRKNGFSIKDREFRRKWQGVQHPNRQGYNTRGWLTTSTVEKDNHQNNKKSDNCALKAPVAFNYV